MACSLFRRTAIFSINSVFSWAYCASRMFAPMDMAERSSWFRRVMSFNCFTQFNNFNRKVRWQSRSFDSNIKNTTLSVFAIQQERRNVKWNILRMWNNDLTIIVKLSAYEKIRSIICRRHILYAKRISHYAVIFHLFRKERISLKKTIAKAIVFFWLGNRDSNPNKQSQSLSCYRYTIPQCRWLWQQAYSLPAS